MFGSVNEPHPSTYMGNPSKNFGTYIWWEYILEKYDMKWDPLPERNTFSIIKYISYISSRYKIYSFFRDKDN